MESRTGVDPGFFLGGGALLRHDVTDWWGKQVLKVNTKKASSRGRGGAHPLHPPLLAVPAQRKLGFNVQCKMVNTCALYHYFLSSSIVSGGIFVFLCFILYDVTGDCFTPHMSRNWSIRAVQLYSLRHNFLWEKERGEKFKTYLNIYHMQSDKSSQSDIVTKTEEQSDLMDKRVIS